MAGGPGQGALHLQYGPACTPVKVVSRSSSACTSSTNSAPVLLANALPPSTRTLHGQRSHAAGKPLPWSEKDAARTVIRALAGAALLPH